MQKRSQAATEMLLTYGWLLLVAIAIIAALAFFGLPVRNPLGSECVFPSSIPCIDTPVVEGRTMQVALKNMLGEIEVVRVDVSGACTGLAAWDAGNGTNSTRRAKQDEQILLSMTCLNEVEDGRYSEEIVVTYTQLETGLTHPAIGRISGIK